MCSLRSDQKVVGWLGFTALQHNIGYIAPVSVVNEREEFMQETQHTQQTATRKAQNQDKKTA